MAMKVRYTVVNGEVLSENRGGVKRDYLPDTQGNTIGLTDNTQAITDTFSYYPYGEVASRTGTTATPFQFLGTLGYYRDSASRTYVRARTLNTAQGRWMTQDPIGFKGGDYNLYRYVNNRPTVLTDPSGLIPCSDGSCDGPGMGGDPPDDPDGPFDPSPSDPPSQPSPKPKPPKPVDPCKDTFCRGKIIQVRCYDGPLETDCVCCSPGATYTIVACRKSSKPTEVHCNATPSPTPGTPPGAKPWSYAVCIAFCRLFRVPTVNCATFCAKYL